MSFKTKLMKRFLLPVLFLFVNTTFAQWTQLNGPEGAGFVCLERCSFGIVCGTDGGAFLSVNEGMTWSRMSSVPEKKISDIINVNDTIVLIYDDYNSSVLTTGVHSMVSFDHCLTWSSPVLIENYSVWPTIQMHHQGNAILISGQWDSYISYDYGQSWLRIYSPNGQTISEEYYSGKYYILSTLNSTTFHTENYISANGTLNWQLTDTLQPTFRVMIDSVLFYSVFDGMDYYYLRTFDFGLNWDTIFISLGSNGGGLYADNNILYRYDNQLNYTASFNYGQTWSPSPIPHGITYQQSIPLQNGDELALTHNEGLVHYVTATDTCFTTWTGILGQNTSILRSFNGTLYANVNYGFYSSVDFGLTWNKLPTIIGGIKNMDVKGDTIVCVTSYGLTRSFDNGITWDTATTPTASTLDVPGLELIGNQLFFAGIDNYVSNDMGDTWISMPVIPDSNAVCGNISVQNGYFREFQNELFIVTNGGLIHKFDQTSGTWVNPFCFFSPGAHNGNYLYVVDTTLVMTGRMALLYSTDGINWTSAGLSGLPVDQNNSVIVPRSLVNSNGIWLGSCGASGIFASLDRGDNWIQIATNSFAPRGIAMLNDILFSGSYGKGIWKRDGAFHLYNGRVYLDSNQNNIFDNSDYPITGCILQTNPPASVTATDSFGNYSLLCDAAGVSLTLGQVSPFVHFTPNSYILDTIQFSNLDFALGIDSIVSDFTVDITNTTFFQPGRTTQIVANVRNAGTLSQNGVLAVCITNPPLQYISSTPSPDWINSDTLYWNVDSLLFGEQSSFTIDILTQGVQWGDSIHCYAAVTPSVIDINSIDNTDSLNEIVRFSLDPNDKTCLQGDQLFTRQILTGQSLDYIVRFQNTGTAPASSVYIIDTLSTFLDWSTINIVSSSHPMHWIIDNRGTLRFDFDSIVLPDSATDEAHSHGFVKYSVHPRSTLSSGNVIVNTAYIYFDLNSAVPTNTTNTLIVDEVLLHVEVSAYRNDINVLVYPNPANNLVHVKISGNEDIKIVKLFNTLGQMKSISAFFSNDINLSLDGFEDGLYIGEITSENGERVATFRIVVDKN